MSRVRYGLPLLLGAQVLGVALADRLAVPSTGWLCAGGLLIVLYGASRRPGGLRLFLALCLTLCTGAFSLALRLDDLDREPPIGRGDRVVEATVCEGPLHALKSVSVHLCAVGWWSGPGDGQGPGIDRLKPMGGILLRAYQDEEAYSVLAGLRSGERLRAWLRVRPTQEIRNPGGRDERAHFRRQGIGFKARLLDPALMVRVLQPGERLPGIEPGFFPDLSGLRRRSAEGLMRSHGPCPESGEIEACGGSLLAALALGDRSGLTPPVREAFARLGLSHLLAVSGLHLVLIAVLSYRVILFLATRGVGRRPYRDRRPWAIGSAIGLALVYALWAGFGVPVQRAWILLLALVPMGGLKRRPPWGWGLVWAALFVLILDPAALFSLGAQLSFLATGGLLLALRLEPTEPASNHPWFRAWGVRAVRTSLVTIAMTAPLLAQAGLPTGGAGLVMNLMAIPWTAVVLLPSALLASGLALLGGEWAMLGVSWAQGLASWSLWVCLESASVWPQGVALGPASGWKVGGAGVLALLIVLQSSHLLRALGLFVGLMLWLQIPSFPDAPLESPRLVMFDVGQGDAVLLQGHEAAVLVDAGRSFSGGGDMGRSVVGPGLRALGVDRLDVVVASHADLDHRGGLRHILMHFDVGEVWLPDTRWGGSGFRDLRDLAEELGIPVRELGAEDSSLGVGDLFFEPLWPPADSLVGSTNENSLVLRARIAGRHILLTGDIGASAEQVLLDRGVPLQSDVLKVAHHGSAHSSTEGFLQAVGARFFLVSASCSGFSGLPSEEAFMRLKGFGGVMGWTGRDGALVLEFPAEDGARLRAWSDPRACPLGEGRS